jgi:hypothetical protein
MAERDLIQRIRSLDPSVRADAWHSAGDAGAGVLEELARLVVDDHLEVGHAARRAMWRIVRRAGRPGAADQKRSVVEKLTEVLSADYGVRTRREALWMISELAESGPAIARVADCLFDDTLREDARRVLERIPGEESLNALQNHLDKASEDFKASLAESLRARGVEV